MTLKDPNLPFVCSLCGELTLGYGNNPEPLRPYEERCCDLCNQIKVIPARIEGLRARSDPDDPNVAHNGPHRNPARKH